MFSNGRPTLKPASNFDAKKDADALRKAMAGAGTDENTLINILCRRSLEQRLEIGLAYKTAYGKDLIEDVDSETSGNFKKVLIALLTDTVVYYCKELHDAMSGVGTNDNILIEILCSLSSEDVKDVNAMYREKYKKSLENDLKGDTSGYYQRLLVSLLTGGRDKSTTVDINMARTDANKLLEAGIKKWGTDEEVFIRVFCTQSYKQLNAIREEYNKMSKRGLEDDIKSEFSGNTEKVLLAILSVARSETEFYASCLHRSMKGLGTDDRSLIRLVVTRCEQDMQDVKEAFQRLYKKSLKSFIEGDTSGDYKTALCMLCGETC